MATAVVGLGVWVLDVLNYVKARKHNTRAVNDRQYI